MASLARASLVSASRASRVVARAPQARKMSGHGSPQEIFESKEMWLKTSIYSTGFIVIPGLLYVLYVEMNHHAHDHQPDFAHMEVQKKRWPWGRNCALFDIECQNSWDGAKKGGAPAGAHH